MWVDSNGKAKHFISVTDDCSKRTEVEFLKYKLDACFGQISENQKEKKIKWKRISKQGLNESLMKNWIVQRLAYNPEQNGVAEEKNRLACIFWSNQILHHLFGQKQCQLQIVLELVPLDGQTPIEVLDGENGKYQSFSKIW